MTEIKVGGYVKCIEKGGIYRIIAIDVDSVRYQSGFDDGFYTIKMFDFLRNYYSI